MQAFGLNLAWTALLAVPAAVLIAFGFAAVGMGVTSYLKSFQQMEWVMVILLPMFLLSGTFFPIEQYAEPLQWIVKALPLWHGTETRPRLHDRHARLVDARPRRVLPRHDRARDRVLDPPAAGAVPELSGYQVSVSTPAKRAIARSFVTSVSPSTIA